MKHLLEYAGVRLAEGALSALPEGAARAGGRALGGLAADPLAVRRPAVERQIAAAFPGRSPDWVRVTARACYAHFGEEMAFLARYGRLSRSALLRRTAGADAVHRTARESLDAGRGLLVVTGHLGNWELAGAVLSGILDVPVAAVVKRQRNARVDRRLSALRRGLGIEPIYRRDAARRIPAALGEGKAVALVADQDARHRGVFVPFMGRPASTYRGPARLALARDVPLFFGTLVREDGAGGHDRSGDRAAPAADYRAHLERVARPGEGPDAERELTRRWVARLEAKVREHPAQYFWFHRRWKSRPENDAA